MARVYIGYGCDFKWMGAKDRREGRARRTEDTIEGQAQEAPGTQETLLLLDEEFRCMNT